MSENEKKVAPESKLHDSKEENLGLKKKFTDSFKKTNTTDDNSSSQVDANEMEIKNNEIKALKNQIIQLLADNDNTRKRLEREKIDASKFAAVGIVKDIATIADNLSIALNHETKHTMTPEHENFYKAIQMILNDFIKNLEKHGVERINPINEPFDHSFQEAVTKIKKEGTEPGMVIDVLSVGYSVNGRLIKPALVVISE